MFKVLKIYKHFRYFCTANPLISNSKKLQKKIKVKKSFGWLHKDTKLSSRTLEQPRLNFEINSLAQRVLNTISTPVNSSSLTELENFYMKYMKRFGLGSFKIFVSRHEYLMPKLNNIESYKEYLTLCFNSFNRNITILKAFCDCDFRQINHNYIEKNLIERTSTEKKKIEDSFGYDFMNTTSSFLLLNNYANEGEVRNFKSNLKYYKFLKNSRKIPSSPVKPKKPQDEIQPEKKIIENLLISGEKEVNNELKSKKLPEKKLAEDIVSLIQVSPKSFVESKWVYFEINTNFGWDTIPKILEALNSLGVTSVRNIKFSCNKENQEASYMEQIQGLINLLDNDKHDIDGEDGGLNRFRKLIDFCALANSRMKTYGFIELNTYSEKNLLISEYYRVFGLNIDKYYLSMEDADVKKALFISNLPHNLDLAHFLEWINGFMDKLGSKVRFSLSPKFKGLSYNNYYLIIETICFLQTLKIMVLIDGACYRGHNLIVYPQRGFDKFVDKKIIDQNNSNQNLNQEKHNIIVNPKPKKEKSKKKS